jgi:CRP-like cAMP-binding protein
VKQSIFWDLIDPADKAGLSRHLRDVALPQAMVLCDVGDPIECVYFPTDGMVSVVTRTGEGKAIETGTVGREGIVSSAVIGMEHSVEHVVVQIAGAARRVSRGAFLATYNESSSFRALVNRYNTFMWGLAQLCAACNAVHPLQARLARWLLQCRARTGTDDLWITQEFLGEMLGVRRTSVTLEAGRLEAAGLIKIGRGHVRILDSLKLKEQACECQQIHEERLARMMSASAPHTHPGAERTGLLPR